MPRGGCKKGPENFTFFFFYYLTSGLLGRGIGWCEESILCARMVDLGMLMLLGLESDGVVERGIILKRE